MSATSSQAAAAPKSPTVPEPLLVGFTRTNIDPPLGISHGNWGAQKHHHASGRHRHLEAFVLLLRQGDVTAVICDVDLCLLRDEASPIREALARAAGTDVENVRLSTSHTHAGPELSRSLTNEDPSIERAYLAVLPHLLAGAVIEAAGRLVPARARAGLGRLDYAVNRRQTLEDGSVVVGCNWEGVTDPSVPVVRFDAAAREPGEAASAAPLAVLFGYAMHPTILGYENQLLSPDYPGVARAVVNEVVGSPALFLQGCAGDQGPGPDGFSGDLGAAERAGRALGAAAATTALCLGAAGTSRRFEEVVMSGATLARWRSLREPDTGTPLRVVSREVPLPVKDTGTVEARQAEVDALVRERDAARAAGASAEALVDFTWRIKRAHIRLRQALDCRGLSHKPVEVHGIRIGEVALLGVPLELFADVGLRVKERSPFAVTHVSGYSNGAYGYLPNRQAFEEGGYEVDATYFLPGADEALVEGMLDVLAELAAATGAAADDDSATADLAIDLTARPAAVASTEMATGHATSEAAGEATER